MNRVATIGARRHGGRVQQRGPGRKFVDSCVASLLASPVRGRLARSLAVLRVRGTRTGRVFQFPVQFARQGDTLVLAPGRPAAKTWWRNLRKPASVRVLVDGEWMPGVAVALTPADTDYLPYRLAYRRRWPTVPLTATNPLVVVDLGRTDPTP